MRFLPDTNAWVQFLRNDPVVVERFSECKVDDVGLSAVVLEELLIGGIRSGSTQAERAVYELAELYPVLAFDSECAVHSARLQAQLIAKGLRIGSRDAQIAGTAIRHKVVLATNDQDFRRIKGLKTVDWQEPTI